MFSTLRTRFGIPGVISVMALVFAMFGGAYAASNSSDAGKATASAKAKKGPRGPKGATGPAGPAGPAGPQGAAGAKGDAGAPGANGSNGAAGAAGSAGPAGKSVLNGVGAPAGGLGTVGDFYIDTVSNEIYGPKSGSGWGSPTTLQGPEGEKGEPWTVGAAPNGALMKGTWAVQPYTAAGAGEQIPVAISTGVPIDTKDFAMGYIPVAEQGDPGQELKCTGTAAEPKSGGLGPNGVLCIYEGSTLNLNGPNFASDFTFRTSGTGVVAQFTSQGAGLVSGYGTWALFAP